jgi:hypothetical protein
MSYVYRDWRAEGNFLAATSSRYVSMNITNVERIGRGNEKFSFVRWLVIFRASHLRRVKTVRSDEVSKINPDAS